MNVEHHPTRRVEAVREALVRLWGDDMPPGTDPLRTVATDGTVVDDEHGRRSDLVVQGDGLSISALRHLVASTQDPGWALELLPAPLAARVRAGQNGTSH